MENIKKIFSIIDWNSDGAGSRGIAGFIRATSLSEAKAGLNDPRMGLEEISEEDFLAEKADAERELAKFSI